MLLSALEGTNRVFTCFAADDQFGGHDGETDQKTAQEVNNQKGCTAIFCDLTREFPNIAKPYGRTGCSQYKSQFRAPLPSFLLCKRHERYLYVGGLNT